MTENKKINLHLFGFIYFVLFFIAFALNQDKPFLKFPKLDENFDNNMKFDAFLAVGVSTIVIIATSLMTKYNQKFRNLAGTFHSLLGPLTMVEIFIISAFSSVSEEFFFRGLIQGKLGIFFASLVFGILHSGPGKRFLPWTIFALLMGFILGGLYEWRENLLLPIAIHFLVNFVNLILLQKNELNLPSMNP